MTARMIARASRKIDSHGFVFKKKVIQGARFMLHPVRDRQTIFVVAVQRSGTTMMMNVLNHSLETDVLFEWDSRAYRNCELHSADILHLIVKGSKAPNVVFKPLCDLHSLDLLLNEFAPAKAIWMLRDYKDVVNSHIAIWTGMPESIGRIVRDRNSAGWRGRGMSDKTHALIRKLYHPHISNASACALFWYLRNVQFFEQKLDAEPRVFLVHYESLVTKPVDEFHRLFDFLGIAYSPRLSKGVFATSVRKRPPADIDPTISELCEGLAGRFRALNS